MNYMYLSNLDYYKTIEELEADYEFEQAVIEYEIAKITKNFYTSINEGLRYGY